MAEYELTTTASIETGESLDITVKEDSTGDGNADNTATQSIDDGTNTYTLSGFDAADGNDVWLDISTSCSSNSNDFGTPTLDSATVEAVTGDIYRGGDHNIDVSDIKEVRLEISGGGGGAGEDGDIDNASGGTGGAGGFVKGDFDVCDDATLSLRINSGRTSSHFDGGLGGDGIKSTSGGPSAGDGGNGAGSIRVFSDVIGDIAIVEGGGGGGGAGDSDGGSQPRRGGGGGGGAARGGLGGGGGSASDGDGSSGDDGDGSGDGGDGGSGGGADSQGGEPGADGADGGQTLIASGSNTSTTTGGGVSGQTPSTLSAEDGKVVVTVLERKDRPEAPDDLSVTSTGETTVDLDWTEPTGQDPFDEWRIYRDTASGVGTGDTLAGTVSSGTTTFTDTARDEGTEYHYAVTAFVSDDGCGESFESSTSNEVNTTTTLPAPTNLSVDTITNDDADLSWTDNASDEDGYKVYRRLTGGSFSEQADLSPDTTTFNDSGLSNGRDYEWQVEAYTQDVTEKTSIVSGTTTLPDVSSVSTSNSDRREVTATANFNMSLNHGQIRFEYKDTDDSSWTLISENAYTDVDVAQSSLVDGRTYDFRARSQTADVDGSYAEDTISTTLPRSFPKAEFNSNRNVDITIENNDNNPEGVVRVFRSTDQNTTGSQIREFNVSQTLTMTDKDPPLDTTVYYTVRRITET